MPKVQCPHCTRTFDSPFAVSVHVRRSHPDQPPYKADMPATVRRRRRKPRVMGSASRELATAPPMPHYCPNCGTNLDVVAHALAAASRVMKGGE